MRSTRLGQLRRLCRAGSFAVGLLAISAGPAGATPAMSGLPGEPSSLARAAEDARLDPRLGATLLAVGKWELESGFVASGEYGVLVLIRGDVDRADLEAVGAVVGTQAGSITTAEVPLAAIPYLLAIPGLEAIEAASPLQPLLTVSGPEVEADAYWQYVPPTTFSGFTGLNVVIGIVDTGIDVNNLDFRKPNNQTRIKYIWDQAGFGSPPSGFTYGTEWTESQINAGSCTQRDTEGHGTHVAGIAAGNGRATGNGYPAYRYTGIAPEADLVIVKGSSMTYSSNFLESKVIDGVNYIFQKAAALGKDAVVLLAMGHQRGGHDGSNSFDTALSALTGPGKLIVAAAGNDGGLAFHAATNLPAGGSATVTFSIPSYTPTITINEYLEIEAWHEPTASFRVKLTSPGGYTTNWVNPGTSSGVIPTADGAILVQNATVTNSKGAKKIYVFLNDQGDNVPPAMGTWTLLVERVAGATTGVLDAWLTGWAFGTTLSTPVFTAFVDPSRLVMSPATGDSIISAGAYTTKTSWLNANGTTSFYTGSPTLWAIASFSSPGPRRDGAQRPDLAAPGYGVMAGLSADESTTNIWKAEDAAHRIRKGTSAAAAHVAGGLAVLLEEQPDLRPSGARALLTQRAQSDTYTGSVPNGVWGYGKMALAASSSTDVSSSGPAAPAGPIAFPNPTSGAIRFAFALTPQQAGGARDGVRIRVVDVQGREVAVIPGLSVPGAQELLWDGLASDNRGASPGVYLAHLEAGDASAVWKFVRLR